MKPADVAIELGVPARKVRAYLRNTHPRDYNERGSGWQLSESQVNELRRVFASATPSAPTATAASLVGAISSSTMTGFYQDCWYWEGNVQNETCRVLIAQGWTIVRVADCATKERGDDINATRAGKELVVEVKGYPWTGYADRKRIGEVKRTNPTNQAKHWFAEAVLRSMRTIGTRPHVEVAIALPDFRRYRRLFEDVRKPLDLLAVRMIWITEDDAMGSK